MLGPAHPALCPHRPEPHLSPRLGGSRDLGTLLPCRGLLRCLLCSLIPPPSTDSPAFHTHRRRRLPRVPGLNQISSVQSASSGLFLNNFSIKKNNLSADTRSRRELQSGASLTLPAQKLGPDVHAKTSVGSAAFGDARGTGGHLRHPLLFELLPSFPGTQLVPCAKTKGATAGRGRLFP